MKERYAFRYNEYLQQEFEHGKVFDFSVQKDLLLSDVDARFHGAPVVTGDSPLSKLGIRFTQDSKKLHDLVDLTDTYGADAVRIAVIEGLPLNDENLTGCWRFIGNLWRLLKTSSFDVAQSDLDVYRCLQSHDYQKALIALKSLIKTELIGNDILMLCYAFMPHLILSFDQKIHEKMKDFSHQLENMQLSSKLFIEINGKNVMDFYPDFDKKEEIIKQALSFEQIKRKIQDRKIKQTIFIPNKGVNFVV